MCAVQFSKEAIDKFIAIYERKFNEPITREDADAMARGQVTMARVAITCTVSLPPEMAKQVEEAMKREHRTRSELVREALR